MQYIEASVIGVRSAVITLKRRATPLRFVLVPMVHVAEPGFYREVAALAGECALIVAEGAPSRYAPMQVLMATLRWDGLVDQITSLDLESLGVPGHWEPFTPSASTSRPRSRWCSGPRTSRPSSTT